MFNQVGYINKLLGSNFEMILINVWLKLQYEEGSLYMKMIIMLSIYVCLFAWQKLKCLLTASWMTLQ